MVLAIIEGIAKVNLGTSVVLTMFLVVVACGYLAYHKTDPSNPCWINSLRFQGPLRDRPPRRVHSEIKDFLSIIYKQIQHL
jgi:hypothetical protein